jgi:tetraacyldisaccharide 4'-kinase
MKHAMRVLSQSDPDVVGDKRCCSRSAAAVRSRSEATVRGGATAPESGVDLVTPTTDCSTMRGRDAEIVVVDGARGFGNGHCLPAGPLREPKSRLAGVDAIVVQGAEDGGMLPVPGALRLQLRTVGVFPLAGGAERPLESFAGQRVHAVAGIGNPSRFFASLRERGLEVIPHPFPDHTRLGRDDIRFGDKLPVLMTEKDAVKCARFAGPLHWYVRVDAALAPADAERLLALVTWIAEGSRA